MIVLASASRSRKALLVSAGVECLCHASDLDEDLLKRQGRDTGLAVADVALSLAKAKAELISTLYPEALVIGADQMLEFQGQWLDKALSVSEARDQLRMLRGQTHHLISALSVVQNGRERFSHVEKNALTMRSFSDDFLDQYLNRMGDQVCTTVGGYMLESLGVQLFDKIEGDYFSILGLPLLPLLQFLRKEGLLTS